MNIDLWHSRTCILQWNYDELQNILDIHHQRLWKENIPCILKGQKVQDLSAESSIHPKDISDI